MAYCLHIKRQHLAHARDAHSSCDAAHIHPLPALFTFCSMDIQRLPFTAQSRTFLWDLAQVTEIHGVMHYRYSFEEMTSDHLVHYSFLISTDQHRANEPQVTWKSAQNTPPNVKSKPKQNKKKTTTQHMMDGGSGEHWVLCQGWTWNHRRSGFS